MNVNVHSFQMLSQVYLGETPACTVLLQINGQSKNHYIHTPFKEKYYISDIVYSMTGMNVYV